MANKKVSQLTSKPAVNLTDLFLIADPTSGQAFKTTISDLGTAIGSGVSSVNTLVGAVVLDTDDIQELASPTNRWFTDTRARAALSASSPLSYNSGTGVFSIAQANGSTNGFLSSADWTTFNAKQAALSGTGFVKISGTTISYDNSTYLTTSAAASTYLALSGGTLTGALNGTSATFTGDLTLSATNPRLYFTDTDNNPDYFISNTDGTFTVYDVTNSTSRFTIGTTGNATFTNAIIGGGSITGTALYSTGIVSVGTSLSVGTFVSAGGSLTGSALYVSGMTAGSGAIYHTASRLTFANYNTSGTLHFEVNGGQGALTLNANLSATFAAGIAATGATFSGGITATTGSFSSTLTTTGGTRSIQLVSFASDYNYIRSNGAQLVLGTQDSQDLFIQTNNTTRLTLVGATGAATFSNSITAPSGINAVGQQRAFSWQRTAGTASDVYSLNADSGSAYLQNDTTSGILMTWLEGGNIGINTTSPTGKLGIYGSNIGDIPLVITHAWGGSSTALISASNGSAEVFKVDRNGAATFNSTISASYGTFGSSVVGDPVYLRVQNYNTDGYPSSIALNLYGYATSSYFDMLRIQASYPGYGSANFIVKNQSNSADVYAMTIKGDGKIGINTSSPNHQLTVIGNTYTEGVYIATGSFSQGASATSTFYTFSNIASNRVFLVTLRQSGGAGNSVVGMTYTYGSSARAYNIAQDNTNPALYLTLSESGLELRLTTGSGYGTTTWDWTITQIK